MTSTYRILIYSNPLTFDNLAHKYIPYKDSGIIYMKNIIANLPDTWHFYWIVPHRKMTKNNDLSFYSIKNKNITLIEYPYCTSIIANRYQFDLNVLLKFFTYPKDVDMIINNQPELTQNLKIFGARRYDNNIPIISIYHWIDCELSRKYYNNDEFILRQIEGAKNSIINVFHSTYAENLFLKEVDKYNIVDINNLKRKTIYITPASVKYNIKTVDIINKIEKPIILFNHRLNNTTNWQMFIKYMKKIEIPCKIWFTDESKTKSNKIKDIDYIQKSLQSDEYGYLFYKAKCSVLFIDSYMTWNMAGLDSLANNCPLLVLDTKQARSIFKNNAIYFNKFDDFKVKLENLINKSSKVSCPDYSWQQNSLQIQNVIEKEMTQNIKNVKNLQKVINYIEKNKKVSKKEFVNKFWKFHYNSNFRQLRKNLLLKFKDDTKSIETFYYK